jgi:hypothetical protein
VRALVAVFALTAILFGVAGLGTILVERRLAALAPGGVEVAALHYNAFTGHLSLRDVRAFDATGREVLRAEHVAATASAPSLVRGALSLGRVRVVAPRLTLHPDAGLAFDDMAAGLGAAHAFFGSSGALALPLRVDDLAIAGGILTIAGAGEGGAPLVVRDLDVRLSRLTTAAPGERDVAFAVEMLLYGAIVHVTGQPRGAGYAVHVRARGLDAVGLARDVPALAALVTIERGQAEIDAQLVLADGRVLASGFVRLADAVLTLPVRGRPRLRATSLAVTADAFDLGRRTGRIARLDLNAPSLVLPVGGAAATLNALVAPLREDGGVVLRRLSIADGTLALEGAGGVRMSRVQLAAHLQERRAESAWVVSGRAAVGDDADVSVDGLVARDVRALDAVTRLTRVPLASWHALAGTAPGWDARVSFDGRLRVVARDGGTVASATGQAELSDVSSTAGGFRAERIALGIRQLRWPAAQAIFDRVVLTRPAFDLAALSAWRKSTVTVGMTVVDGEVSGSTPGRRLHDVGVELARDDVGGLARLRLSAATDTGSRIALDRVVAVAPVDEGVPLGLLAMTLEEAARAATLTVPSALPVEALP